MCPLSERGWRHPYFSPCLIFWCFWIKPKAQKKNFKRRKIFRSILREASRPSIRRLLRGAGLPPFVTKRWRQKCPQGTSVGIGRRFSLSGHKRLRCFAHPLRALAPVPSLLPLFSQCDPAGRRPAMCGRKQIIIVACSAPQPPPCEKCGELHRPDNLAPRAML